MEDGVQDKFASHRLPTHRGGEQAGIQEVGIAEIKVGYQLCTVVDVQRWRGEAFANGWVRSWSHRDGDEAHPLMGSFPVDWVTIWRWASRRRQSSSFSHASLKRHWMLEQEQGLEAIVGPNRLSWPCQCQMTNSPTIRLPTIGFEGFGLCKLDGEHKDNELYQFC